MYQKATLDNGLRVVTSAMPHTRSVSIGVFIRVGSRFETGTEAGISHFIEHLLFRGTQRRPSPGEISGAIEGVGGILNGGTDKELTVYWCKVARPHFQLALDVLVDMLLHSRFDPSDIERERQVIIDEINLGKDFPPQRVGMLVDELLWPDHPLGRDVAGSKESVAGITRDRMLDYLHRQYLPANSVVAIAGNIEHNEMVAAVSQALGGWSDQKQRAEYMPYNPGLARRLQVDDRPTEQAHLCLALPGLSLSHPGRFALDLLNVILGEGMSSRLFTEIRDRLGLAYSIHSCVEHFLDSGSVVVYAGVEPKSLGTAIEATLEQLSRLRERVPEAELCKAKELSKGRLLLRMEDSRSVAGWGGGQEVLSERILSQDQVVSIIDAITAEELEQLAQELIVGHQLRLAVVGPVTGGESLEGMLKL